MPEQEDFALRAAQEWGQTLPGLGTTEHELSALIRLSRIARIQDRIDAATLREFEKAGIKGSDDFRALALLRRTDTGLSNSQLLEQLGGSKAGISMRLDRLTQHGITKRVASKTDGRSHTNVLTAKGRTLADRLVVRVVTARKQLLDGLTAKQVQTLTETLGQIIADTDPNL